MNRTTQGDMQISTPLHSLFMQKITFTTTLYVMVSCVSDYLCSLQYPGYYSLLNG